jgi:hypothetical protein
MRKRFKLGMALGAMALAVAAGKPAQAAIVNPSFEDSPDFNGWTTAGSTAIQDLTFRTPPAGDPGLFAVMSTGPSAGIGGSGSPQDKATLAAFLGVTSAQLDAAGGGTAFTGSAIKQINISGNAGDTIGFTYDFFTNETRPQGTFNDFAFVVVDGVVHKFSDVNAAANALPAVDGGGSNQGINAFGGTETGYLTSSIVLASSGTHTLSFGVENLGDINGASGLIVDQITQTPGTGGGGVPLPAGMYLMPLGLVAAGAYSLKLRRTAAC